MYLEIIFVALVHLGRLVASQPDIVIGTSLPLNNGDGRYLALVQGIELAFAEINAKYVGEGCVRNVSLVVKDNGQSAAQELVDIQSLVVSSKATAIVFSSATNDILEYLSTKGVALIGSLRNSDALSTPFRRNVFNIVPSFFDEAATQVRFLANYFVFTRLSLVIQDGPQASEISSIYDFLLKRIGLRAASVHILPATLQDPAYLSAMLNITAKQPQAILTYGFEAFSNLLTTAIMHDFPYFNERYVFLLDSSSLFTLSTLPLGYLPPQLYITTPLPLLNDTIGSLPIVQTFRYAADRYATDHYAGAAEYYSLAGYVAGRFIVAMLDTLGPRRNAVTPVDFVDAVYAAPVMNTSDGIELAFAADCNAGGRHVYIARVTRPGNATMPNFERLSKWINRLPLDSCISRSTQSAASDAPYVFGAMSTSTVFARAVRAAFEASNQNGAAMVFGRSTYVADDRIPGDADTAAASTGRLLETNGVLGLVGFEDSEIDQSLSVAQRYGAAFFGPITGNPKFRLSKTTSDEHQRKTQSAVDFTENFTTFVNIRASWIDEVNMAVTHYASRRNYTRFGFFGEATNEGRELRSAILRALDAFGQPITAHPPRLTWQYLYDLADRRRFADIELPTSDDDVDIVLMFCRVSAWAIDFFRRLSTPQASGWELHGLKAVHIIWALDTGELLHMAQNELGWFSGNITSSVNSSAGGEEEGEEESTDTGLPFALTIASSFPTPWEPGYNISADTLSALYCRQIIIEYGNETFDPSLESLEGFVLGRFLLAVISSTANNATCTTVANAVFEHGTFSIASDFRLGPYVNECDRALTRDITSANGDVLCACNQGPRALYLLSAARGHPHGTTNGSYWEDEAVYAYNSCFFPLPQKQHSTKHDRSINDDTMGLLIGLICAVGVVMIAAAVLVLIIYKLHKYKDITAARRRCLLKEPNYQQLATASGAEFLATSRVAPLFYANIPPILSEASIRERLQQLEKLLVADVDTARFVVRILLNTSSTAAVDATELAHALGYLYQYHGKATDLVVAFVRDEVRTAFTTSTSEDGGRSRSPSITAPMVLFRQDNFLSKLYKVYSRLVGLPFLWHVLAEEMFDIEEASHLLATPRLGTPRARRLLRKASDSSFDEESEDISQKSSNDVTLGSEDFSLEIDPKRVRSGDDPVANSLQLRLVVHRIVKSLQEKMHEFPSELRTLLLGLRWALEEQGELGQGLVRSSVATFVFLRFLCPAITSPQSHGLFRELPTAPAQRFLILLSKVLLNLGLGVPFEKEDYMLPINDFLMQNSGTMRELLDAMSTSTFTPRGNVTPADKVLVMAPPKEPLVTVKKSAKTNALKLLLCYLSQYVSQLPTELPADLFVDCDSVKWAAFVDCLKRIAICCSPLQGV